MMSFEDRIKLPTWCFVPAGPDNRGELGGGHTHRSAEDSECEGEEVQ